jgi:hypothetical protein
MAMNRSFKTRVPVVRRIGFSHPLLPVGHDQCDERTGVGDRGEHQLQHPDPVMKTQRARAR